MPRAGTLRLWTSNSHVSAASDAISAAILQTLDTLVRGAGCQPSDPRVRRRDKRYAGAWG
jgi:hypothetical protein